MAKDDYFVIVYQILSYLYRRLKKGESIDIAFLSHDGPLFKISRNYWAYILYHMQETGLIEGVAFYQLDGMGSPMPADWEDCQITPDGIAYLCENSMMEKAKAFLKEVKDVVTPFI